MNQYEHTNLTLAIPSTSTVIPYLIRNLHLRCIFLQMITKILNQDDNE
jgi:hypothetical protein